MLAESRGCVFFNFGVGYALRLLVAIHSLRKFYDGPITTLLSTDRDNQRLASDLMRAGSAVEFVDRISKSLDRHALFARSPYRTTLLCDSDLLFLGPIDDLWEPLEREGLLVTRFFPNPYGIDGTSDRPGFADRVKLLAGVRRLVEPEVYAEARRRLIDERIDINIGVMGLARPRGDAFLAELARRMELGRGKRIQLLDEMLVCALVARHPHALADERWNCPADEYFRRTNLADARVLHYFADGHSVDGQRLGRNPATWAGRKWRAAYREAAGHLDLREWKRADPTFPREGLWNFLR